MKKHLFAISTYFATFFISFFLVSLLTERPQTKATSCFPSRNVMRPAETTSETEQQTEITYLLKRDQKFGFEYFATEQRASDAKILVENMRSLDNSDLPLPIRKAYKTHTQAWNAYADHLRGSSHKKSDRDCINLNRDISETYNTLLLTAENYGVDFPN